MGNDENEMKRSKRTLGRSATHSLQMTGRECPVHPFHEW